MLTDYDSPSQQFITTKSALKDTNFRSENDKATLINIGKGSPSIVQLLNRMKMVYKVMSIQDEE